MGKIVEIGVVLLAFAFVVFVIFPVSNDFTACFSMASGRLQILQPASVVGKETFCKDGQKMILSLNSCIEQVKSKNTLAPLLFRLALLLPKTQNVPKVIDKHNQVCPQYPIPQIFSSQ